MVRTVVVDDEPDSILVLKKLLEIYCPDVEVVGEALNIREASLLIETHSPDLALLDISMNNESSFDLLTGLGEVNFQVIFITAHDKHAIEAFKYSAVDYLLKPVDGVGLARAVDRATKISGGKKIEERLKVLLDNINTEKLSRQKMAVPTMQGLSFVILQDIMRLEAKGAYTMVVMSDGKQILTTRPIKEYENLLPGSIFYRVHNSHIVNLNRVLEYQKGRGGSIIMEDESSIEVAIRRKEEFLNKLLK